MWQNGCISEVLIFKLCCTLFVSWHIHVHHQVMTYVSMQPLCGFTLKTPIFDSHRTLPVCIPFITHAAVIKCLSYFCLVNCVVFITSTDTFFFLQKFLASQFNEHIKMFFVFLCLLHSPLPSCSLHVLHQFQWTSILVSLPDTIHCHCCHILLTACCFCLL